MSAPAPDPPPTIEITSAYHTFLHNTSLTMLFLSPVLLALPPRKLDLYTLTLAGSFVASANHLTKERTGRGLLGNLPHVFSSPTSSSRFPYPAGSTIPATKTKADEFSERYRAEKEKEGRWLLTEPLPASSAVTAGRLPSALETAAKELWVDGEKEGWKERRLREEQEKIAQGEGYGTMIMDQIREVWNWGEQKGEEIKETDKKVLYQREQEEKAKRREEEFPTIGGKEGRWNE